MQLGVRLRKHAPTLVVGGLLLAACAWFKLAYDHQHFHLAEKLAVISDRRFSASFRVPDARSLHFILAIPDEAGTAQPVQENSKARFSGRARILDSTNAVVEFKVSPALATGCNWLDHRGLKNAYALHWPSPSPRIGEELKPGRAYTISVEFDEPPPSKSSLWMSFVILNKDRASAKNLVLTP